MGYRLNVDWQALMLEHKQSGKTVKDFCREKGFSVNTFYINRQKLNDKGFVKLNLQMQNTSCCESIKLEYQGLHVFLEEGFSKELLHDLFEVLGIIR